MVAPLEGRQLDGPIVVPDLLNGKSIATLEAIFPLREVDFVRLQGGPPITATLATMIFSGVVGFAFSLGPKIEALLAGQQSQITSGETKTIVIGLVLSVVLYLAGFFLPTERTKVMKRISKFFESANTAAGGGAK